MARSELGTRLLGSRKKSSIRRGPGTRVRGGKQRQGWLGVQISGWQRVSMYDEPAYMNCG